MRHFINEHPIITLLMTLAICGTVENIFGKKKVIVQVIDNSKKEEDEVKEEEK